MSNKYRTEIQEMPLKLIGEDVRIQPELMEETLGIYGRSE